MAHRDLKPANILISDDRQSSILTDFGSMTERTIEINNSRKSQQIQEWAAENCSMFYRAPELFEPRVGTTVNEKADTWSLGCILFAMLYNVGPFDYVAEKGDSIALAVSNAKYFIPNQIQRPEYLIKLLKKTIVYEQTDRENLSKILSDLDNLSNMDMENENQQIV